MLSTFSPDKARRALPQLDLAIKAPLRGELADYARHYQLDTLADGISVQHYLGTVDAYGFQIATHVFFPINKRAKGTLLIVHGYFDHVGLYRHAIAHGLSRGYAVVAFDLPGHGLSSGATGVIEDFQHYQEMLLDLVNTLKPQLPTPWVAMGQSTGGAILMDHVLSSLAAGKRPLFVRVQLLAPLVRVAQWRKVRLGQWLFGRWRIALPRHMRRSSSDADFIDFLWNTDPLQFRHIPLVWLNSMVRWERYIHDLPRCRFPISVVQGERDETVDWRYNLDFVSSRFFVEGRVQIPEASHHLVNERSELRMQLMQVMNTYLLK